MWFVFFTISNGTHSPVAIHLEGHAVPSVTRTMELKGAHNSSCFTAKPPPPPKILQRPPPPQRGALAWTSGAKAGPPLEPVLPKPDPQEIANSGTWDTPGNLPRPPAWALHGAMVPAVRHLRAQAATSSRSPKTLP